MVIDSMTNQTVLDVNPHTLIEKGQQYLISKELNRKSSKL